MKHSQMPPSRKRTIFFSRSQSLRLLVPSRLGIVGFNKEILVLVDPGEPVHFPPPPLSPPPGGWVYIVFPVSAGLWGRVREGEYQT